MAQVASIVVPAVKQVYEYMLNVQAALPDLDIGVVVGTPTAEYLPKSNTLWLGSFANGGTGLMTGYQSTWNAMAGGINISRQVPLSVNWSIIAWAATDGGDPETSTVLENLDTLWNNMLAQFMGDPGMKSVDASAMWNGISASLPIFGPSDTGGVMAVIEASTSVRGIGTS